MQCSEPLNCAVGSRVNRSEGTSSTLSLNKWGPDAEALQRGFRKAWAAGTLLGTPGAEEQGVRQRSDDKLLN